MPTSVPLIPTLTGAGIALAASLSGTGITLPLTHIGFGTSAYIPDGTEVALQAEVQRVAIAGGGPTSANSVQVYAQTIANTGAPYWCSEIGFYSNSTLVAVFSRTSAPILYISDQIVTAISYALGLAALPPNSVTVTVDPSASAALAALGVHVSDPNAHQQYVQRLTGVGVYDPLLTYDVNATVIGDDGRLYQAAKTANIGKTPSISPTWWTPVDSRYVMRATGIGIYDPTVTYANGALVVGDDGRLYQSAQASNVGETPSTSPTWWTAVDARYVMRTTGVGVYDATVPYTGTAVVIGDDAKLYQSLQANNTGHAPSASPTWWGPVSTITATQPAHVVPLAQVQALIQAAFSAEAGKVAAFAMSVAPTGWVKANGAAVSRTAYANLFAQIGTTYGAGDGSTTFNLPDYRGEFLRGFDDGRGVDTGRVLGSFQADSFASHAHGVNDPTHAHAVADPTHAHPVTDPTHSHFDPNTVSNQTGSQLNGVPSSSPNTAVGTQTNASATGISVNAAGTGIGIYGAATGVSIQANGGTETRPRNKAALYCIKF